jgi:uncharacterized membrane protein YagU involved in acid resistance
MHMPSSHRPILAGGLVAGTLDLVYICTLWGAKGVAPIRILHSIASGWVGREAAIAGGMHTALLGLVSHYAIATCMAAAYWCAARRLPALARRPFAYGPLYGVVLYVAMNHVVVPLSAAGPAAPMPAWMVASHLAAHMFLVGTTIAWFAHRATNLRCAMAAAP